MEYDSCRSLARAIVALGLPATALEAYYELQSVAAAKAPNDDPAHWMFQELLTFAENEAQARGGGVGGKKHPGPPSSSPSPSSSSVFASAGDRDIDDLIDVLTKEKQRRINEGRWSLPTTTTTASSAVLVTTAGSTSAVGEKDLQQRHHVDPAVPQPPPALGAGGAGGGIRPRSHSQHDSSSAAAASAALGASGGSFHFVSQQQLEVLRIVADRLPTLSEATAVSKRENLVPLYVSVLTHHPDHAVRNSLWYHLLHLFRKPTAEQRLVVANAAAEVATRVNKSSDSSRMEREVLGENLQNVVESTAPEFRCLAADIAAALAVSIDAAEYHSTLLAIVVLPLCGDRASSAVRRSASMALAKLWPAALDQGTFLRAAEAFVRLVLDVNSDVANGMLSVSSVLLAQAEENARLLPMLVPVLLKFLLVSFEHCSRRDGRSGGSGEEPATAADIADKSRSSNIIMENTKLYSAPASSSSSSVTSVRSTQLAMIDLLRRCFSRVADHYHQQNDNAAQQQQQQQQQPAVVEEPKEEKEGARTGSNNNNDPNVVDVATIRRRRPAVLRDDYEKYVLPMLSQILDAAIESREETVCYALASAMAAMTSLIDHHRVQSRTATAASSSSGGKNDSPNKSATTTLSSSFSASSSSFCHDVMDPLFIAKIKPFLSMPSVDLVMGTAEEEEDEDGDNNNNDNTNARQEGGTSSAIHADHGSSATTIQQQQHERPQQQQQKKEQPPTSSSSSSSSSIAAEIKKQLSISALFTHHLHLAPALAEDEASTLLLAQLWRDIVRTATTRSLEIAAVELVAASCVSKSIKESSVALRSLVAVIVRVSSDELPVVRRCCVRLCKSIASFSLPETAVMITLWPALLMFLVDADESVKLLAVHALPSIATNVSSPSFIDRIFQTISAAMDGANGPLSVTGAVAVAGMSATSRKIPSRAAEEYLIPTLIRICNEVATTTANAARLKEEGIDPNVRVLTENALIEAFEGLAELPTLSFQTVTNNVLPALTSLRQSILSNPVEASFASSAYHYQRTTGSAAAGGGGEGGDNNNVTSATTGNDEAAAASNNSKEQSPGFLMNLWRTHVSDHQQQQGASSSSSSSAAASSSGSGGSGSLKTGAQLITEQQVAAAEQKKRVEALVKKFTSLEADLMPAASKKETPSLLSRLQARFGGKSSSS